jgi:hypothetical protein
VIRPRLYQESLAGQTARLSSEAQENQLRYASRVAGEIKQWVLNARLRGVAFSEEDVCYVARTQVKEKRVVPELQQATIQLVVHLLEVGE